MFCNVQASLAGGETAAMREAPLARCYSSTWRQVAVMETGCSASGPIVCSVIVGYTQ